MSFGPWVCGGNKTTTLLHAPCQLWGSRTCCRASWLGAWGRLWDVEVGTVNWYSIHRMAKYSALIYCNVLYTIGISLHQYSIQNFKDLTLPPETLTDIIKRFTDTYCKNTVPFISSHLLLLRLFAFGIHKRMSHPPSIIILDREMALIRCKNVNLTWKICKCFSKSYNRSI